MEKYSKAVSEMYSQFKQREAHPMEKYIGKHVVYRGKVCGVVGYATRFDDSYCLIVDVTQSGGWSRPVPGHFDSVFGECKRYLYASINDLID